MAGNPYTNLDPNKSPYFNQGQPRQGSRGPSTAGLPGTSPSPAFFTSAQAPRRPSMVDQAWLAMLGDYKNNTEDNKRQYNKVQGTINSNLGRLSDRSAMLDRDKRNVLDHLEGVTSQVQNSAGQALGGFDKSIRDAEGRNAARTKGVLGDPQGFQSAMGGFDQAANRAGVDASKMERQGQEAWDETRQGYQDVKGRVNDTDQFAMDNFEDVKSQLEKSKISFANNLAMRTASVTANTQNTLEQLRSDPNMTPEMRAEATYMTSQQNAREISMASMEAANLVAQHTQEIASTLGQLGNQVAQIRGEGTNQILAAGDTRLKGAQTAVESTGRAAELRRSATMEASQAKGQLGLAKRGQDIEAAKFGADADQMSVANRAQYVQAQQAFNELNMKMADMYNTVYQNWDLQTSQWELQGFDAGVNWQSNNVYSRPSLFNGISAILAAASAPGAGSIGAGDVPDNYNGAYDDPGLLQG